MQIKRTLTLTACAALSGCVFGYGHCLFVQPVRNSLKGVVHFRDYPDADGVDNVAILALDRTAYVYAPAQSHQCLPVNDVQMTGLAQFPENIGENSHVTVDGSLFEAATPRQHTRFVFDVVSMLPIADAH
jgi:hypothetical protein